MSDSVKKYFEDIMESPEPNVNQNYVWEDKTLNIIGWYVAPMQDRERGRTFKSTLEISKIKFSGHDVKNIMCADIIEYIKEDLLNELDGNII